MSHRFAFLVLEEHPYGREMLRILLQQGFMPGLIVEEVSAVAGEERAKFLTRIAGQTVPPTFAELLANRDIPRLRVDNHNSPACQEMLDGFGPDLVVLGGTRILRPHILEVPPLGTINAHPGLLRSESPRLQLVGGHPQHGGGFAYAVGHTGKTEKGIHRRRAQSQQSHSASSHCNSQSSQGALSPSAHGL